MIETINNYASMAAENIKNGVVYVKENCFDQLTERQKLISLVALAILALYCVNRVYRYWTHKVKPLELSKEKVENPVEIEAVLRGKIFYNQTVFHLDGNFRIDEQSLINGNGTIHNGKDTYEGEFRRGRFMEGTATRFIEGKKYTIEVKEFKYLSVVNNDEEDESKKAIPNQIEFQLLNEKVLYDDVDLNLTKLNFEYEGSLKGSVVYGTKAWELDSEKVRIDRNGLINGKKIGFAGLYKFGR